MLFYAAFTMGLLGSMHCLGMCGPIAMALPVHTRHMGVKLFKYLLYNMGRLITYSILGLLMGVLGDFLIFAGFQQALSILTGLLIILSVLIIYQPFQYGWITKFSSPFRNQVKKSITYYFQHATGYNIIVLGMLNGLLPCGMIYAALLGAMAAGSSIGGSLFMMAFGLGTVPLMLTVSFAGDIISHQWKSRLSNLSPVFACAIGALLILRGLHIHIPAFLPVELENAIYNCH